MEIDKDCHNSEFVKIVEEIVKNSIDFIHAEIKLNTANIEGSDFFDIVINTATNIYGNMIGKLSNYTSIDPFLINDSAQNSVKYLLKKFK